MHILSDIILYSILTVMASIVILFVGGTIYSIGRALFSESDRSYFDKWSEEPPHENQWKRYENLMVLEGPRCQFFAPSHKTRIARWNGTVYGGESMGRCAVTVWEREMWGDSYRYTRVTFYDQQADMYMNTFKGFARNEQHRISGAAEVWAKEVYTYGASAEVNDKYRNFEYSEYMNEQRKKSTVTA